MGKDQELLQAVKTEDLLTVQKLLQRPRPGKASKSFCLLYLTDNNTAVCSFDGFVRLFLTDHCWLFATIRPN